MGIGVSIFLIAAGAILAFAVDVQTGVSPALVDPARIGIGG